MLLKFDVDDVWYLIKIINDNISKEMFRTYCFEYSLNNLKMRGEINVKIVENLFDIIL